MSLEEDEVLRRAIKQSRQIYIDLDGVLSDFDAAIFTLFGTKSLGRKAATFWRYTAVEKQVFRKLEPIPEGIAMVKRLVAAKLPICFLTSTGGGVNHIDIAVQKVSWLEAQGLGSHQVALCMSTAGKARFAHTDAILIDDRQKVLDEWAAGGGLGILYTRETAADIAAALISANRPTRKPAKQD